MIQAVESKAKAKVVKAEVPKVTSAYDVLKSIGAYQSCFNASVVIDVLKQVSTGKKDIKVTLRTELKGRPVTYKQKQALWSLKEYINKLSADDMKALKNILKAGGKNG